MNSVGGPSILADPERLAVKTVCAADILKKIVESAHKLRKTERAMSRYLDQARLLLVWRRGCGAVKMAGSAAKTVSLLMMLAAPLHPRLQLGLRLAHKLWKVGTSVKMVSAVVNLLRDTWHSGCRSALLDFTRSAAALTRNLSVLGEVLRDLQAAAPSTRHQDYFLPTAVLRAVQDFVPPHQVPYASHIINMIYGSESYSPLFAFTSITQNIQDNSNVSQILLEAESFHFDNFVDNNDSRTLVAIGSFLHISKELFDFLDGFQNLTDQDCRFLQDCLKRFSHESVPLVKAVSVLVSLDQIRKHITMEGNEPSSVDDSISLYDGRDSRQPAADRAISVDNSTSLYDGRDIRQPAADRVISVDDSTSLYDGRDSRQPAADRAISVDDSTSLYDGRDSRQPAADRAISDESFSQSTQLDDIQQGRRDDRLSASVGETQISDCSRLNCGCESKQNSAVCQDQDKNIIQIVDSMHDITSVPHNLNLSAVTSCDSSSLPTGESVEMPQQSCAVSSKICGNGSQQTNNLEKPGPSAMIGLGRARTVFSTLVAPFSAALEKHSRKFGGAGSSVCSALFSRNSIINPGPD